ncbi:MAG: hypothetical protein ACW98Y_08025 [Candidatus Thorarchaeota archaeon]|jgi:hypothetical protein
MSVKTAVREIFVIHPSGLPVGHVGTGQVEIDDALFGGLLSALENVGLTLGIGEGGALDTIRFRAYEMLYFRNESGLIVLLTGEESSDFYRKAKDELQEIGDEIDAREMLKDFSGRTSELLTQVNSIIKSKARTIFSQQDDVFIWDDFHTFQLSEHQNERWKGMNLFMNYLVLSPLMATIDLPMDNIKHLCDLLVEKRRPSEILNDPILNTSDPQKVQDTIRFLHLYGVVHCFVSSAR